MIAYVETSAILAIACGEPDGPRVKAVLDQLSGALTSRLTVVECSRVFHRRLAPLPDRVQLDQVLARFEIMALSEEILDRAAQIFPVEPIRALDALHVASAVAAADAIPDLVMVALDKRVRQNALALDLSVLP